MIKKRYLTEVAFKNGVDEFKSFRTFTKNFKIKSEEEVLETYRIILDTLEVDLDTLSLELEDRYEVPLMWRRINGEGTNYLEIYTDSNNVILNTDTIVANYVGLNSYTSDLYSVDYDTGTLYLASSTNIPLKLECEFYNIYLTGRYGEQIDSDKYSVENGVVSINNINTEYNYTCLYNKAFVEQDEYITPYLRTARINFINTDEKESF